MTLEKDATGTRLTIVPDAELASAALRVLHSAQKVMKTQGSMVVRNVKPEAMEIFEVTGFVDLLTIET